MKPVSALTLIYGVDLFLHNNLNYQGPALDVVFFECNEGVTAASELLPESEPAGDHAMYMQIPCNAHHMRVKVSV